jgi:hypothetical protein
MLPPHPVLCDGSWLQDNVIEIKPDISHILPGLTLTLRVKKPGHGGSSSRTAPASSNRSSLAAVADEQQNQLPLETEVGPAEHRAGPGRHTVASELQIAAHQPIADGSMQRLSAHPPSPSGRQHPAPPRRSTLTSSAHGSGAASSTQGSSRRGVHRVTDNPLFDDQLQGRPGAQAPLPASMQEARASQQPHQPVAKHIGAEHHGSRAAGTSHMPGSSADNHNGITAWVEEQIARSKRVAGHDWMAPRPPLTAVAAYVTTQQAPHLTELQHTGWGLPHKQGCAAGGSHDDAASDLDSAIGGQGGKPSAIAIAPAVGCSKTKTVLRSSQPKGPALAPVGVDQAPLASIREASPLRQGHASQQPGLPAGDHMVSDVREGHSVDTSSDKVPWPATVVHTSISLQQLLRRLNQGEITPQGFLHTLAST